MFYHLTLLSNLTKRTIEVEGILRIPLAHLVTTRHTRLYKGEKWNEVTSVDYKYSLFFTSLYHLNIYVKFVPIYTISVFLCSPKWLVENNII